MLLLYNDGLNHYLFFNHLGVVNYILQQKNVVDINSVSISE